jgi:hypothetical protein
MVVHRFFCWAVSVVVISALRNFEHLLTILFNHAVYETVLFVDPSRPPAGPFVPQGLRLSDTFEWVSGRVLYQSHEAVDLPAVGLNPICQVVSRHLA